jgi:hypothetical protein
VRRIQFARIGCCGAFGFVEENITFIGISFDDVLEDCGPIVTRVAENNLHPIWGGQDIFHSLRQLIWLQKLNLSGTFMIVHVVLLKK